MKKKYERNNINQGDYKKDNKLINSLNFIDNKQNRISITLKEEKLIDFLFYSLQKQNIINRKSITKNNFYWTDKHEMIFKGSDGIESQSFRIELNRNDIYKYLKIYKDGFKKNIIELLLQLKTRTLRYITSIEKEVEHEGKLIKKTILEERDISPLRNSSVILGEEYKNKVYATIDIEFVYLTLFSNDYSILNMNIIKDLKSKYSLRFYQEARKSITKKHYKFVSRSLENLNKFFNSNLPKQDMDRNLMRVKQEFLLKSIYTFDYSMKKNENKEWIFIFSDIGNIDKNKNILEYISTYEDYRLLTNELKNKFETEYETDFNNIMKNINEKEMKKIQSRTRHLQK